jgi:hypothetical protein
MAKPAREQDLPPLHRSSALPGARSKQHQAADGSVLATQLAKHLDLSRQRVQQLVDELTYANLANLNLVTQGTLLSSIEVQLMCVGAGPTLDFADASALLAKLTRVSSFLH